MGPCTSDDDGADLVPDAAGVALDGSRSDETLDVSTPAGGANGPPPETDTAATPPTRDRGGDPERVVTFTDGVFAIIITILVLDVRVPENLGESSLRAAIEDVGPTLVAWIVSFLITGMYWVWHRDVFSRVAAVNRDVVWLNLLFLMPVALIPFASSLLGEYNREPTALHVYGVVLISASLLRSALFMYLARHPQLLDAPLSRMGRRIGQLVALGPIAVYGIAIAVADAAPILSLSLYGLMPLLYFLGITVLRGRSRDRDDAEEYS